MHIYEYAIQKCCSIEYIYTARTDSRMAYLDGRGTEII